MSTTDIAPPTLRKVGWAKGTRTKIELGFIRGNWTWETLREQYDKLRNRKGPLPPRVALEQCFCVKDRNVEFLYKYYFRGVDTGGKPLDPDRKTFFAYMEALLTEVDSSDNMLNRWDHASVKMQNADPWRYSAMAFPRFIEPLKTEREKEVVRKAVTRALIRGQGMLALEAGRDAEKTLETLHALMEQGDVEQAIVVLKTHTVEAYGRALTERD